jgi:hypothetical protein
VKAQGLGPEAEVCSGISSMSGYDQVLNLWHEGAHCFATISAIWQEDSQMPTFWLNDAFLHMLTLKSDSSGDLGHSDSDAELVEIS